MCLIVQTLTPYTKSQIRWKIFNKVEGGRYTSCFQREFVWPVNKKATADKEYGRFVCGNHFRSGGFHVYVTRKDARKTLNALKTNALTWGTFDTWKSCVIRKVKVDNFICGGLTNNVGTGMDGLKSEAWAELEILD